MDSSKNGLVRRCWTSEQRQRLLTRFHQNEMTQQDFATRHGVGLSTLSKWLRLEPDAGPAKVKFQEIRVDSCRRHGLKPFDYLRDLFTHLPAAMITQIKEFTPAAWVKTLAKEQVIVQAA